MTEGRGKGSRQSRPRRSDTWKTATTAGATESLPPVLPASIATCTASASTNGSGQTPSPDLRRDDDGSPVRGSAGDMAPRLLQLLLDPPWWPRTEGTRRRGSRWDRTESSGAECSTAESGVIKASVFPPPLQPALIFFLLF